MDYKKLNEEQMKEANAKDPRDLQDLYDGGGLAHVCEGGKVVGYIYEEDRFYD